MRTRHLISIAILVVAASSMSACSLFEYTPPKPDATGLVRVGCSKQSGYGADEMAFCDQRAREACDGPALLLDATFGATPRDPKTGAELVGQPVSGVARYQCTPR